MSTILAIESSCDETSAAILSERHHVKSCVIRSQIQQHAIFRGVVPEIASRLHTEVITAVIDEALSKANMTKEDIDAIAVTNRPGLVGALLIGVTAAKCLALAWHKPLIGIDHIQAHLCSPLMVAEADMPMISAAISGGHTELYVTRNGIDYDKLGATIDDAAGEAFDKCAAILDLPYPGGPSVSKAAESGNPTISFPLPICRTSGPYDFTFSGIKTAVLYHCKGVGKRSSEPTLSSVNTYDVAASFQHVACKAITKRLVQAANDHNAKTIGIGGGVACNGYLRTMLQSACVAEKITLLVPPPEYCTDNAAMIGALAQVHYSNNTGFIDLDADVQSRTA